MPYLLSVIMSRFFSYCIDTFYMHKHTHLSGYFCQVTKSLEKGQHLNNFHPAQKLNEAQTQTSPYLLKNSETILCYKKICRGKYIFCLYFSFAVKLLELSKVFN